MRISNLDLRRFILETLSETFKQVPQQLQEDDNNFHVGCVLHVLEYTISEICYHATSWYAPERSRENEKRC